jgi:hypothetical protein
MPPRKRPRVHIEEDSGFQPTPEVTPGLRYFRCRLIERFEPRPEHKTTRQWLKYVAQVVESVSRFDEVVLSEAVNTNWVEGKTTKTPSKTIPTVEAWVKVCRQFQERVNRVNRDLESLGMTINLDPFYTDPDPTKKKSIWWP